MNGLARQNLTTLLAALAFSIGASLSASAGFVIVNNEDNETDVSSQLSMEVSGIGSQLTLRFFNNVGVASSVTDIYIDFPPRGLDPAGPAYATLSSISNSGDGVAFGLLEGGQDLQGANSLDPVFVASVKYDSNPPVSHNGVNTSTEWVALNFTLGGNTTVNDVIAALASGNMRVGLHVQAVAPGSGSQSYVTTPVPEPTTLIAGALLLLPFGMSALRVVRRNKA